MWRDNDVQGHGDGVKVLHHPIAGALSMEFSGFAVDGRPDLTMDMIQKHLTKMWRTDADFVFTVNRDFVKSCQTPVLVMPDDIPAHPYAVAMECAMLAPKAEVSMYPWKEPRDLIPLAVRHVRTFLKAHQPATASR